MEQFGIYLKLVDSIMLDSISFIGGGVMGEAIVKGLLAKKLLSSESIIFAEPRQERRKELERRHGVNVAADNIKAAGACEMLVLSVKLQDLDSVMADLKVSLHPISYEPKPPVNCSKA